MEALAPVDTLFKNRIENIHDLPVLPQVHMQALRVANDPDGNAYQLQEVLRYDPILTAKILRVANSAYYGFPREIESLRTALVMLGTQEVVRLISTTALISAFKDQRLHPRFDPYRFWEHSIVVAEVSNHLGRLLNLPVTGDVFTGGLLHDIGSILMGSHFQDEYETAVSTAEELRITLREAELKVLGLNHADVGGLLADQWNLPTSLTTMIRHHHEPKRAESHFLAVSIVYLANRIANRKGKRLFSGNEERPVEFDPAWRVLASRILPAKLDIRKTMSDMDGVLDRAVEFTKSVLAN